MRRSTAWLISIAILGVFGVALLWPLAWVIRGGFLEDGRFTVRFLAGVFQNPVYVEGLIRSLRIAVGTTTLVLTSSWPMPGALPPGSAWPSAGRMASWAGRQRR